MQPRPHQSGLNVYFSFFTTSGAENIPQDQDEKYARFTYSDIIVQQKHYVIKPDARLMAVKAGIRINVGF